MEIFERFIGSLVALIRRRLHKGSSYEMYTVSWQVEDQSKAQEEASHVGCSGPPTATPRALLSSIGRQAEEQRAVRTDCQIGDQNDVVRQQQERAKNEPHVGPVLTPLRSLLHERHWPL